MLISVSVAMFQRALRYVVAAMTRTPFLLVIGLLLLIVAPSCGRDATGIRRNGRIVFVRYSTASYSRLYVMSSDGTHVTLFAKPASRDVLGYADPAWSPDGKRIAVTSDGDRASWLSVIRSDGMGVRDITSFHGLYVGDDYQPTWSPDAHEIAYSSFGVYNPSSDAIFKTHLSDTGRREVERPLQADARSDTFPFSEEQPDWSPDGRWIAFNRWNGDAVDRATENGRIALIKPDGKSLRLLAAGENPDWSPDSAHVAYDHLGHIEAINADGKGETQLTSSPATDFDPEWSPDGQLILFSRVRHTRKDNRPLVDLWIMNADGSNPHRLAANAQQGSWQPLPHH
ncbi:MAG: hypothetical protein M3P18_00910 [Actinomycetota bacterium]|nr:hypothetical protein [Actinomycetota bacterium]